MRRVRSSSFDFPDGKIWEALGRYRRRRDSVGLIFKTTAGTSTHRRAPFIVSPSRSRVHHPFFPFEYLHITSLGYAHLLLIVCNLLDLRVYPFTHLRRALKGTLCHGVHNAFFLPSALAPLFQPHTFTHSHMHTDRHTHTHSRIAYISDAVFVAYAFPVYRHPSTRGCIRTAFVTRCCFSGIL